ncbi:uncharacterized protein BDZ99DRAFT_575239 [Mytilinidion resinicola]|uniref:Uncharacterized protein n=1 Tax=Mytilinidion resinicola TaxID=574789 RepID=A0A6A6Y7C3_9PEZI|nr:uncharacterized protein BDZ99DRAFT_575239 [Mytilinidion resinicola]KAF2804590.1 hypothetical protein BDZ99DRAFT_575239 [Mytilinidion resinicola]
MGLHSAPKWDPETTLNIINHGHRGSLTCVGYAYSKHRGCKTHINAANRASAFNILEDLKYLSPHSSSVQVQLYKLARHTLCLGNHQSQVDKVVDGWMSDIAKLPRYSTSRVQVKREPEDLDMDERWDEIMELNDLLHDRETRMLHRRLVQVARSLERAAAKGLDTVALKGEMEHLLRQLRKLGVESQHFKQEDDEYDSEEERAEERWREQKRRQDNWERKCRQAHERRMEEQREKARQRTERLRKERAETERRETERREEAERLRKEDEKREEEARRQAEQLEKEKVERERREEERQRREQEEKLRKAAEERRKRETEERNERARQRAEKMRKEKERLAKEKADAEKKTLEDAWLRYSTGWGILKKNTTKATSAEFRQIIPWPVVSGKVEDVNDKNVEEFYRKATPYQDDASKMFLFMKMECLNWHTDRLPQRLGDGEVDATLAGLFNTVMRMVIKLRSEVQERRAR